MTHILVPLDGSPLAETVLPCAEELARRARGHVTLLHVAPVRESLSWDHPGLDEALRRSARLAEDYLHDHRRRMVAAGVQTAVAVATGRPAAEIVRWAERADVDLIALSTHGRSGVQSWTHGSVADEVLRTTAVPLLLLHPGAPWSAVPHGLTRIVVPLDGSAEAETALDVAEPFAARGGVPVTLLRCVEPLTVGFAADPHGVPLFDVQTVLDELDLEARGYLERMATQLRSRGVHVTTEVSMDAASEGIAASARTVPGSIVVLTSHGRTGWRSLLLGSVARRVAQRMPTPVIVCPVRPREAAAQAVDGVRGAGR